MNNHVYLCFPVAFDDVAIGYGDILFLCRLLSLRKLPCVLCHPACRINRDDKLRKRHGKPYGIPARQPRQGQDQRPLITAPRATDTIKDVTGFISA